MDEIRIQRTGATPLVFRGEAVAESSGRNTGSQENNRWHDLTVYRTAGGQYVCRVDYHTAWQGELDTTEAEAVDAADIAGWFASYSPAGYLKGFPPSPQYADRQAHLVDWVTRRYEAQVGELLAQLGDDVAERIE